MLEMFRFGRLVVDDCQLLARDLELLLAEPKVSSYLPKAAPLYAVQAMCAQSRWGIADAEPLGTSKGHGGFAEVPHVATCAATARASQGAFGGGFCRIACFLGVQIPYGDSGEAVQRSRHLGLHASGRRSASWMPGQ